MVKGSKDYSLDSLIIKMKEISNKWHPAVAKGDQGAGRTLEKLLGVEENNISLPDYGLIEIKSKIADKDDLSKGLISLFTKEPLNSTKDASVPKKKARFLLKEATKLKKSNQIEKAIDLLNQAYDIGEYCYPSQNSQYDENTNLDNYITIEDLIRKSKYLQEIGQFDQAISFINQLIKETSKRAKESVWEIDELSTLHHHKSIILKKEKKFKEEFINRIKSYCLDGIAMTYKFPKKSGDTFLSESYEREVKRIRNIVNNLTDHQNLMSFIEKNLKKIELNDNQKRQLAGFMMKMILLDHNEEVYKSLKELDKLMENL